MEGVYTMAELVVLAGLVKQESAGAPMARTHAQALVPTAVQL